VRIAQYCPLDLTTKGGLQTAVLCLSRALTRLGHEVEVVCQRGEPAAGLPFVSRTAFNRSAMTWFTPTRTCAPGPSGCVGG